jgi:hypothetical protein
MAQDNNNDRTGSEDATEARQHMRNVQENRDALEEQARRVDASAPDGTDRPVEGVHVRGMGGEDNSRAVENQRDVQENLRALQDQSRRVEASTPDDINRTGPQNG